MSELLSRLQQLGDGEIDDLSIAHDASEEIVALRLRVAELEDRCTEQSTAVQGEPVAWMHDSPGRVDVIHASVKKLLGDSRDAAGDFHRPLDKSEHYTIPLYAAPQPAPDVSALVEALERIASWPDGGNQSGQPHIKMFAAKALAAHQGRKIGNDQ